MLNELTRPRKILFFALIAAMLLTLAFIFSNSLRGPEASMEQSNEVGGFISVIFPPDTALGGFIDTYTRKIAHFTEYGVLGLEVAVFVTVYLHKRCQIAAMTLPGAMCIAVIDETLQYFSGRGPAISDVWIDLGGFASFSVVTYAIAALVIYAASKRRSDSSGGVKNG